MCAFLCIVPAAVFFDVAADGSPLGRIEMTVRASTLASFSFVYLNTLLIQKRLNAHIGKFGDNHIVTLLESGVTVIDSLM